MKPRKLTEQEWELEFPSAEQYKGQFAHDMEAWETVVNSFPEDVQLEIEGLLYRMEDAEHVDNNLMRQLSTIFQGNSKDDQGQRIAKWLKVLADFGDFFAEAHDLIIDSHLGPDEEPKEEPER